MLASIFMRNFRSFAKAELKLSRTAFLIGQNASGKSNALDAVRLLKFVAQGGKLSDIAQDAYGNTFRFRGRTLDLFRDPKAPLTIGCRLEGRGPDCDTLEVAIGLEDGADNGTLVLKGEEITDRSKKNVLYRVSGRNPEFADAVDVGFPGSVRGKGQSCRLCSSRHAVFHQLASFGGLLPEDEDARERTRECATLFAEALSATVFVRPVPDAMRGYSRASSVELKEDGSNLSGVLARLCEDNDTRRRLVRFLSCLRDEGITDISFVEAGSCDVMVRLGESFGRRQEQVAAPLLADGTLRVLALGAALLGAPGGSLVVLDEVDGSLHPGNAGLLVEGIRDIASSRGVQVLMTTHNASVLNAVPLGAYGDVLCCYRDPEEGDSRVVRLGDSDRSLEIFARGPLGRAAERNVMERELKDRTSEEERVRQRLAMFEQFVREARG